MKLKFISAGSLGALEEAVNTFLSTGVSALSSINIIKVESLLVAVVAYTESSVETTEETVEEET